MSTGVESERGECSGWELLGESVDDYQQADCYDYLW